MKTINRVEIANYQNYQAPATDWLTITQEQVNQFADCTHDHQFIHIDPARAKATPFGGTIAHGFLSLSLLSHFSEQYGVVIEGCQMGVNYGLDKVRFINPVRVGSRIRAVGKIISIEEKSPGQFLLKSEVTLEIEGEEKPALIAQWLGMQIVK